MTATLTLWGHALAALLFGIVVMHEWRRADGGLPRRPLLAALGLTALWALAVAGIDTRDAATRLAEGLRNFGWLIFMLALARRHRRGDATDTTSFVYGVVLLVVVVGMALAVAQAVLGATPAALAVNGVRLTLRMMVAVAALILLHHLHLAIGPRGRGGVRFALVALAAMWGFDLVLYLTAYFAGSWPAGLVAARGFAMAAIAPLFALAAQRDGDWTLHVSRTVAYQWLLAVGVGLYVGLIAFGTALIDRVGGANVRVVQTAFVLGTTAALFTIASTPWLRAWVKVIVAKHLFRHRYDYRAEWLRFTDTLGVAGDVALDTRVVKALADVTDSPAGLLLVPDGAGLAPGTRWNWPGEVRGADAALVRHLEATRRIVELDAVRAGRAAPDEAASIPAWLHAAADAWAIVPLVHFGALAGAIVLARPPIDRALDWEDFDLLGAAGRQAASYLAEDRAHDALADAQRFDEFNRRFAFIMHDLKNLVSQLSLVARNAERHADNPAFRADMVATLKDSSDRMNALLARLSQHQPPVRDAVQPVPLLALADRLAQTRRAQHPVLASGDAAVLAAADPATLEVLLGHLVQNAIEASDAAEPVRLAVYALDGRARIEVIDRGCGMSPGFVRDRLFRPFVSSKPGGFGIGAFEARQLAAAMGGTLDVASREGEGTRFSVTLPLALPLEAAA